MCSLWWSTYWSLLITFLLNCFLFEPWELFVYSRYKSLHIYVSYRHFPSLSSPTHLAGADFDGILFITFHFVDNISYIMSKNSAMPKSLWLVIILFSKGFVFCIWLFGPITHLGWGSAYGMMLRVIFVYLDLNVLVPYMGGGVVLCLLNYPPPLPCPTHIVLFLTSYTVHWSAITLHTRCSYTDSGCLDHCSFI